MTGDKKDRLFYFCQGGVKRMGAEDEDTRDDNDSLLLLHLSDIHFREPYCLDPETDPDHMIREVLRKDIRSMVAKLGKVDAILICGDIAYKANGEEYNIANGWIKDVVRDAGCSHTDVYTVPGNHDVNQTTADGKTACGLKTTILGKPLGYTRDKEFIDTLMDEEAGGHLIKPMAEYNQFAAPFGCDINAKKPFWIEDLKLASGWTLKMHGLTTTLFSGDQDKEGSLYLGASQHVFPPVDGIVRLAMMHHPPEWVSDGEAFNDSLYNGCVLHLQGHRHLTRLLDSSKCVRISGGAVNPNRLEKDWKPSYNLIKLQMLQEEERYCLQIDVHQRIWQDSPNQFVAKVTSEGESVFTHRIRLQNRPLPIETKSSAVISEVEVTDYDLKTGTEVSISSEGHTTQRDLVFDFWSLSITRRHKVIQSLNLLNQDDKQLPEPERYRLAFKRARERGMIGELKEQIYKVLAN